MTARAARARGRSGKERRPAEARRAGSGPGAGLRASLVALAIFVLSFGAFAPALRNDFTNWDDPGYVTENTLIRDHSWAGVRAIFSTFVEGNYHPLTMLSLAADYAGAGLEPRRYHLTNVVLNAANAVLVLWFALLLTGSLPVAAVAAGFFGIHPLHVESVAWVSARKDLLYTFFFLGSCVAYLLSVRREGIRPLGYAAALLLFTLSLLSKGMAVTLPLTFVLIDWYRRRPFTRRSLLEKAPFFLLALVFGVVAIVAQREKGAIQQLALFPIGERLLFACYGLAAYVVKAFVPIRLAALYPYPGGGPWSLPLADYAAPPFLALLAYACWRGRRAARLVVFGAVFFLLTVVLVLQLLPVGRAIIADRYTYVPYVGVGLALGEGFRALSGGSRARLALAVASLAAFGAVLFFATRARCAVWRDNVSLWSDEIAKYPNAGVAYNNLALTYKARGQYEVAMAHLERALRIDPNDIDALSNRGNILFLRGKNDSAMIVLDRALAIRPSFPVALNSRGAVHFNRGEFEAARADFDRAIAARPDYPEARLNRANTLSLLRRWPEAMADYDAYLRFDPANARAREWRAIAVDSLGAAQSSARR